MKIKLQWGLCLILRRFDEDVRRVSKGDLASTVNQYPNRGELPRIVLHGGGEKGGVVLYSGEGIICAVVALFEFLMETQKRNVAEFLYPREIGP